MTDRQDPPYPLIVKAGSSAGIPPANGTRDEATTAAYPITLDTVSGNSDIGPMEGEATATGADPEFVPQGPECSLPERSGGAAKRMLSGKFSQRTGPAIGKAREILRSEQATKAAKVVGGLAAAVVIGEIKRRTANPAGSAPQASENSRNASTAPSARIGGLAATALARELERRMGTSPGSSSAAAPGGNDNDEAPTTASTAWSPPKWSGGRKPEPADPYIGPPIRFHLGVSELAKLEKHPELPGLFVEVTMTGFQSYALAIDWPPRVPRIFYSARQIPESWTAIQHDEHLLPMELRRDESSDVWCRWLPPSPSDREFQRTHTSGPIEPARVERRIRVGLDMLGRQQPRWHA